MTPDEKFAEHETFWEQVSINADAARAFLSTRGKLDDAVLLRALGQLRRDLHDDSWDIA